MPRGLYFSKALFRRGLSTKGNLRFKIDWASLIVGSKVTVFALFYFVPEGNFPSTSPRGLQGRIQDFFRRGCTRLLLYFNTNKPHSFFFSQNNSCIRKPQVISGGRGGGGVRTPCTLPLDPPLGLYLEGRFNREFFALSVWGLIFGGAYFRNFTVYVENLLLK